MTEQAKWEEEVERRRRMSDGSLHNGWFYLPVDPQDHGSEWIKAKQTSRGALTAWRDTVMEGRGEGGSALCWGDMGKTPERSSCGVRTMLKLQMAACEDYAKKAKSRWLSTLNTLCSKAFEGICVDSFLPLIHLQRLKCCADSRIRGWIDLKRTDC